MIHCCRCSRAIKKSPFRTLTPPAGTANSSSVGRGRRIPEFGLWAVYGSNPKLWRVEVVINKRQVEMAYLLGFNDVIG